MGRRFSTRVILSGVFEAKDLTNVFGCHLSEYEGVVGSDRALNSGTRFGVMRDPSLCSG